MVFPMKNKYEYANGTLEGRAKSLEHFRHLERFGTGAVSDTDVAGGGIPTPIKSTLEDVRPDEIKDETDHLARGDPPVDATPPVLRAPPAAAPRVTSGPSDGQSPATDAATATPSPPEVVSYAPSGHTVRNTRGHGQSMPDRQSTNHKFGKVSYHRHGQPC